MKDKKAGLSVFTKTCNTNLHELYTSLQLSKNMSLME
jgi:hypothetical protein